jgi:hypothetical protein
MKSIMGYIEFRITTAATYKIVNRRTLAPAKQLRKVIWKDLLEIHACSIDFALIALWTNSVSQPQFQYKTPSL